MRDSCFFIRVFEIEIWKIYVSFGFKTFVIYIKIVRREKINRCEKEFEIKSLGVYVLNYNYIFCYRVFFYIGRNWGYEY